MLTRACRISAAQATYAHRLLRVTNHGERLGFTRVANVGARSRCTTATKPDFSH